MRESWHEAERISEQTCLMCRNHDGALHYATLYVHQFCPDAPKGRYEDLATIPDRLRWLRKSRGLRQSEVAEHIGITRTVYLDIECGETQHIQAEVVDELAALYGAPFFHLMDGYGKFIYMGQGKQIRKIWSKLGMRKKQSVDYLSTPISSLRAWKSEKKVIGLK